MAHDTSEGVRPEGNCRLQQELGPLDFLVRVYPQDRGVRTKMALMKLKRCSPVC